MISKSAEFYFKKFDKVKELRITLDNVCNEIATYTLPRKYNDNSGNRESNPIQRRVYDNTAIDSNIIFAAGLHTYMTNPASRWFSLTIKDRALLSGSGVKQWLNDAENITFDVLNSTNFHDEIHEVYLDLGAFGTSYLGVEEDDDDISRFKTFPFSSVWIVENKKGRVSELFLLEKYTVQDILDEFPNAVPKFILDEHKQGNFFKEYDVLHIIGPRDYYDVSKKDITNKRFFSLYYLCQTKELLKESGYDIFPIRTIRFAKRPGKFYGYSPAMCCFPAIETANEIKKTALRASNKLADPTLIVPYEGFIMPITNEAGGVNYSFTQDGDIKTIKTGANVPVTIDMLNEERSIIKKSFFVDMFLALVDKKNMTATEVQERVAEKMLMLGPSLGRLMNELLDPVVYGQVNDLIKRGIIPPPPASLINKRYVIEYISPLAKAQRAAEVGSIQNLMIAIGQMIAVPQWAEAADNLNADEIVLELHDVYGAPQRILNTKDKVQDIREQRQQMQQANMQLEAQKAISESNANTAAAEAQYKKAGM